MAVGKTELREIKEMVHEKLQKKIASHKPITTMDNHIVLKGMVPREATRQYSAIQSLVTSIGMSFYEQIAVIAARSNSDEAYHHWESNATIASARLSRITKIKTDLGNRKRNADIDSEIKEVLGVPNTNQREVSEGRIVDVYFRRGDDEYYVEIKTRANKGLHLSLKEQMLRWVARADKAIHPIIAVAYNPYHPEPYRGIGVDVMQLGKDLLVGKEFWDLVGGKGFYEQLEKIFKDEGTWYWKMIEKRIRA